MDDIRGPRRGADDDWGSRRDDDRVGRRGMEDGPRRGEDAKPWKPLGRPGEAPPPKSAQLRLTAAFGEKKQICTHISA